MKPMTNFFSVLLAPALLAIFDELHPRGDESP